MKKLLQMSSLALLAAFVLIGASYSSSYAQKNSRDVAVGAVFAGIPTIVQAQFETATADDQSLVGRAMYGLKTSDGYSGFGIGAAYRFYLLDTRAVEGLSIAPAVELMFYNNSATSRSATIVMIGGEAGYKLMLGQISIEPVLSFRIGVSGGQSIAKFTSTLLYPGVYLGYAW